MKIKNANLEFFFFYSRLFISNITKENVFTVKTTENMNLSENSNCAILKRQIVGKISKYYQKSVSVNKITLKKNTFEKMVSTLELVVHNLSHS